MQGSLKVVRAHAIDSSDVSEVVSRFLENNLAKVAVREEVRFQLARLAQDIVTDESAAHEKDVKVVWRAHDLEVDDNVTEGPAKRRKDSEPLLSAGSKRSLSDKKDHKPPKKSRKKSKKKHAH